jgi:predicted O-methyltransferase YrrM
MTQRAEFMKKAEESNRDAIPTHYQKRISFSQLWVEEEDYLIETAAQLHASATVVEIGTAQGGSAFLLAQGSQGKDVRIFTFDIAPSHEASVNLAGTGVNMIPLGSFQGARLWLEEGSRPIDLLFIDGSHTLFNVLQDFRSWAPFLRLNSLVLFHDYDPLERGGYPHLGVKVAVDAIKSTGCFAQERQEGRIFAARIVNKEPEVSKHILTQIWKEIGTGLFHIIDAKGADCLIQILMAPSIQLILNLLQISGRLQEEQEPCRNPSNGELLWYARPFPQGAKEWEAQGRGFLLSDLKILYLLQWCLECHREAVLEAAPDRPRFFKLEELLEMLDHFGDLKGIKDIFNCQEAFDEVVLSRIISREIVRLYFLSEIRNLLDISER